MFKNNFLLCKVFEMGRCKFKSDWLRKSDCNGYIVAEWGRKASDHEMFCTLCVKTFNISWGYEAVEQHASSRKHKEECKQKLSSSQLHLTSVRQCTAGSQDCAPSTSVGETIKQTVQLYNIRDSAAKAELIWVMKTVAADFPLLPSCEDIRETFEAMFPSSVPTDFSLSRTKAQYLITDALAPFFKKQMLNEMDGALFTLCFDETVNAGSSKELQTAVKYWSPSKEMIVTRHLQTFFMGSATADELYNKLCEAIDNTTLLRTNLLMLSNDGPNVNKAVTNLMNESLILLRKKRMVDIGTCNIHILHNAFRRGMKELGDNASNLIFLIHDFFDGWPSRWEDFEKIQNDLKLPKHRFIKHVSSRWLSLESAGLRLLEQWPAVTKYFMVFVPKYKSDLMISSKYKNIVSLLKVNTMKVEINFACSSAHIFSQFTGHFQKEEPLIHLLYDHLKTLTSRLMTRICHSEVIFSLDSLNDEKSFLPLKEVNCGLDVKELQMLPEKDKLAFLLQAKKHFIASCKHIFTKSSLTSKPLLKHFECLIPSERTKDNSWKSIVEVAKALPIDLNIASLIDEWKLLSLEEDELHSKSNRIDVYWNQFFKKTDKAGEMKYPLVSKVVKAALSLSHGSADVERGFSSSQRFMTSDRASMSERTLDAYLHVKFHKLYDGKVHLVHINKELLNLTQSAYIHHRLSLIHI